MLSLHHSVLSYVFKKDLPKPSTLPDFFKQTNSSLLFRAFEAQPTLFFGVAK